MYLTVQGNKDCMADNESFWLPVTPGGARRGRGWFGGGCWEVFMTWANNLPARAGSPKQISQRGASFQEPARKIKEPLYFHLRALEFVFCNKGKVKSWSQEFELSNELRY